MSSNDNIPGTERPLFFDGQRLTAADLQAVQEYQRQLRWLHNRSLHTWGIVFGLEVIGARADREVKVQPGFALDCLGRELVLSDPATLPIPPVAGSGADGQPLAYYLTISYIDDDQLSPSETGTGMCDTSGAIRLPEMARLRFQSLRDTDPAIAYRHGKDVILASINVLNCKLSEPPSPRERRDARPANQPYVATGLATAAASGWSALQVGGSTVGVKMKVDTSAAGFGSTPVYLAQVTGERALSNGAGLVDGLVNVADAGPTGFTLQVLLPRDLVAGATTLNPGTIFGDPAAATHDLNWAVAWMGIEG